MPASSKAQQRFFGVVKSMQKGDKPKKGEAGKIAKQMSKKDVDKYASTKHKGKPEKVKREMKVRELIKKMVREELANLEEVAKRDYKAEYKKFQSSDKSKKYRAELNKYNRQKGTYGNGDGKDASHKGGKIVGFEKESVNRGRAEKSRLKKEEKLKEVRIPFSSSHIKQLKRAFKDMKGTLPDNNPLVQKIVQLLKGQDKKTLQQLANADIKYLSDKAKDILGEGTCGYGENGELGEEPAGPHLIKKKLKEAKESPIEVAKRIVKNKQYEKYKGMMLDLFTANAIVQVHDKVNDTMKKKLEKLPLPKLVTLVYKVIK